MGWNPFGNGSFLARGFNTLKGWYRSAAGGIRSVASAIGTGARALNFLPGAGLIATASDAVGWGLDAAGKVFDTGEAIQRAFNLQTTNNPGQSTAQAAAPAVSRGRPMPAPPANAGTRAPVANINRPVAMFNRPVLVGRTRVPVRA